LHDKRKGGNCSFCASFSVEKAWRFSKIKKDFFKKRRGEKRERRGVKKA